MMPPPRDVDRLFAAPIIRYGTFSGLPAWAQDDLIGQSDNELFERASSSGDHHELLRLVCSEVVAWRAVERARLQRS